MTAAHDPVEVLVAQARDEGWPARCDPSLAFEKAELAQFVDIWQAHCHGRAMPQRSDLTARILKPHLSRIMLFERVMDGEKTRYRVRLMATALTAVWNDATGKFIDDVIPPRLLPRWNGFIGAVLMVGRPLRFLARVEYQGKDHLITEIGAVPLADDCGQPTMVMAAIHKSPEPALDAMMANYDGIQPSKQRSTLSHG